MIVQVVAITWSCDVRKDFNQITEVYVTFSFARGGKVKLLGEGSFLEERWPRCDTGAIYPPLRHEPPQQSHLTPFVTSISPRL